MVYFAEISRMGFSALNTIWTGFFPNLKRLGGGGRQNDSPPNLHILS